MSITLEVGYFNSFYLKRIADLPVPLGGKEAKKIVSILTEFSHLVRRALSKKLDMKFLPRLAFVEDNSFEYAEKIERLINTNKKNDKEKNRNN